MSAEFNDGSRFIAFVNAGIELMAIEAEELHEEGDLEALADLNANISTAFCSLAELYLTDLWYLTSLLMLYLIEPFSFSDVDDAENTCRALLEKAIQYDESNAQALQVCWFYSVGVNLVNQFVQSLGSYYISMEDPATALKYVQQSVALWFKPAEVSAEEDEYLAQLEVEADAEIGASTTVADTSEQVGHCFQRNGRDSIDCPAGSGVHHERGR